MLNRISLQQFKTVSSLSFFVNSKTVIFSQWIQWKISICGACWTVENANYSSNKWGINCFKINQLLIDLLFRGEWWPHSASSSFWRERLQVLCRYTIVLEKNDSTCTRDSYEINVGLREPSFYSFLYFLQLESL